MLDFCVKVQRETQIPVDFVDKHWRRTMLSVRYGQFYIEVGTKGLPKGGKDNFMKLLVLHEVGHMRGVLKVGIEAEYEAWAWAVANAKRYGVSLKGAGRLVKKLHVEYGRGKLFGMFVPDGLGQAIAKAHRKRGGATFSINGKNLMGEDLYAVGMYTKRSVTLPKRSITKADVEEFVFGNSDSLVKPRHVVGTWLKESTGESVLDVSVTRENRETAIALGRENRQEAVYYLKTGEEISI